jgi:hypothetical protein
MMLQCQPTGTSYIRFRLCFKSKKEKGKLACAFLSPFEFPRIFLSLFLQCLFRGEADTLVLQVESTRT